MSSTTEKPKHDTPTADANSLRAESVAPTRDAVSHKSTSQKFTNANNFNAAPTKPTSETQSTKDGNTKQTTHDTSQFVAMQVLHQMALRQGFMATASSACATLAVELKAQRVSIGWYEQQHCRLVGSSRTNPALMASADKRQIEDSMIEAINQQTTISNVNPEGVNKIALATRALAKTQHGGGGIVISIPLALTEQSLGAICVEYEMRFASSVVRQLSTIIRMIEALVPPTTKQLAMAYELDRTPIDKFRHRTKSFLLDNTNSDRRRRKIAGAAIAVLALGILFIPFKQNIISDALVEGASKRSVSAPTNGYLRSVAVRPGDRVRADQVLANLGEQELELKHDRLTGQVSQFQGDVSTAIAQGDRSAMAIARSQVDQTNAELGLIQQQLDMAKVRAPIAGIVIDGDLSQSIGTPVDRGQSLFTIAPIDSWRVMIDVDEKEISKIQSSHRGMLYLSALPWDSFDVTVTRIAPAATISNTRNVFKVEASIAQLPPQIRPGLRGTVRLEGERQSLAARLSKGLRDAIGRVFWRWNPW